MFLAAKILYLIIGVFFIVSHIPGICGNFLIDIENQLKNLPIPELARTILADTRKKNGVKTREMCKRKRKKTKDGWNIRITCRW